MPVTLNASTSSGLIATSDTSGNIELQSNGVTKATVSASGMAIGQYTPSTSLITSGTAVASTSGTSIDFTSIPSWVKRVTVMFSGVSTNGSSPIMIQLGTSGGIEATSYRGRSIYINAGSAGDFAFSTGFNLYGSGGAGNLNSGNASIALLGSNIWTVQGGFGGDTTNVSAFLCGAKTLSGTLDRVRITTINGTDAFDAGSINILYE